MFARTTTYQIPVDKIDTFIRDVESRRSRLEQMPGWVDGYWMANRKTGNTLVVTLFDSEESLRSSEGMATQIRSEIMRALGVTNPPPFQTYEVGVEIPGRLRRAAA